jgi:hypothetical protein
MWLDEHCPECTLDGAPIAPNGGFRVGRDQILAVPLEGLRLAEWQWVVFVYYADVDPWTEEPDPAEARVALDGEPGAFLRYHGNGALFAWASWPAAPQMLTVSYTDESVSTIRIRLALITLIEALVGKQRDEC